MSRWIHFLALLFLSLQATVVVWGQKPELVMQVGHNDSASVVGFIRGGKILVTRGDKEAFLSPFSVKLWEVETGRLLLTIPTVDPINLSPDGRFLATTGFDDSIKVWNLATGQIIRTLKPQSAPQSIGFSADGRLVAAAVEVREGSPPADVTRTQTWEVTSGKVQVQPQQHIDQYEASSFFFMEDHAVKVDGLLSPDNRILAKTTKKDDRHDVIELRDAASGKVLQTIDGPGLIRGSTLAFSPDGKILAGYSDEDRKVILSLWDVATGATLSRINSSLSFAEDLSFSSDARVLAFAGNRWDKQINDHGVVELVDVAGGQIIRTIETTHGKIPSVAFSPDNRTLASGSDVGVVDLWNVGTGEEIRALSGYNHKLDQVSFSPDGSSLVISKSNLIENVPPSFILWGLVSGAEPRTFNGEFLDFSKDSRTLLFKKQTPGSGQPNDFGKYFTVTVIDVETGTELRTLEGRFRTDWTLSTAPNGKVLAGEKRSDQAPDQTSIDLWSLETGRLLRSINGLAGEIKFIEFSPDSSLMAASVKNEKTVELWTVATGKLFRRVSTGFSRSVQFSPDGKLLASINGGLTSEDSESEMAITVWSLATNRLRYRRALSVSSLQPSIGFSPNGKLLAGASLRIDLWRVADGEKVQTFDVGSRAVGADLVALPFFSPDGRTLLSYVIHTNGARIQLWDIATGRELSFLNDRSEDPQAADFSPDGKTFVTLGRDGLIKLWDFESGEAIASLALLDQNDWLVVAPNGRFDGTTGAWNKLLWRFPEDVLNVAPVEVFFNEFYSPDLLADIMSGNRFPATRKIDQIDRRQPQLKLSGVDWQSGDGLLRTREMRLRVAVTEAHEAAPDKRGSGAQDVRLFRNGSLVKVWHGDVLKGQSEVTLEATVTIVSGENRFTAYAFNHDNIKSADVELTVKGAETLKRSGTAYILAVGIDSYSNQQYNLKYAVADAENFAAEIKHQQETLKNYERVEVIRLYDEAATKSNIRQALAQLAQKAQPEDAVIVYFSGHGAARQQRFYLIPHDLGYQGPRMRLSAADLNELLRHSISDRELEAAFEQVDAGRLLMVIDACNSGQALDSEEKRRGPMNSKGLAQLAYEKGMYILTAAQSYQAAWEASKLGHGYLTYALIEEGLKQGAADHEPKDQTIFMREWLDYATQRVPRMQQDKLKEEKGRNARGKRSLEFVFVEGQETVPDPVRRRVQRPRVFYRREYESSPMVIARPPVVSPG